MKSLLPILGALLALGRIASGEDLEWIKPEGKLVGYCVARIDDGKTVEPLPSQPVIAETPKGSNPVALIALPERPVPFQAKYHGFTLLLVNRSEADLTLYVMVSSLRLHCEALDKDGQWKPIDEPWRRFGCGNDVHRVTLPSQRLWSFAVPHYSGPFKTKLRYVLVHFAADGKTSVISNEFEGSIDPALFAAS